MKTKSSLFLSALALTASAVLSIAQDAPAPTPAPASSPAADNGGGRTGRGGRGNFEEFRQRMEERLKTSLKATNEEWAVIQPLMEKVQSKQREAMGGRFGGFPGGRRGGGEASADKPGAGGEHAMRGGSAESQALRTTLENESASPDEIKAKLAAVREQRKKAADELTQARADLSKVLTVRQEAVLVSAGILE